MTKAAVDHIHEEQDCTIAIIEMSKADVKEWLQFKTIEEEETLYAQAEVDQELSHDGEHVKA